MGVWAIRKIGFQQTTYLTNYKILSSFNTRYMISIQEQPIKCIVPATSQPVKPLETSQCGNFLFLLCGYICFCSLIKIIHIPCR